MLDLSGLQRGQIIGAHLTRTSVTETSQLVGFSRCTVPMTTCTQRSKTSSVKQNCGGKEKLSEKDRQELKWIEMSEKRPTAAKVTTKPNQHLDSPM
ncbi:hypothetical protein TNCV_4202751 [Trichonephila clavipes]|uniref:Uncharacterized protein n=1 Tax=Trichonephila clavipes TaxID=2585209 RepID=A0A8X6S543_TRICX|nr:hypothetical protein TNCV_4202751 [Trichonephila clavipes]